MVVNVSILCVHCISTLLMYTVCFFFSFWFEYLALVADSGTMHIAMTSVLAAYMDFHAH